MKQTSFFIQSVLMVMLYLITAFTNPCVSSFDSLGSPKNQSADSNIEWEVALITIKPNESLAEGIPYVGGLGALNTVIGFVSSVIGIYQFFDSIINPPKAPEKDTKLESKVDAVLKTMDAEFSNVKVILDKMDLKMSQMQIQAYISVEKAISIAIEDFKYKVPSDKLGDRPFTLHNDLNTLMKGMLGQGTILPDLLASVRDLYDCGSSRMLKKMEEYITLVNVGLAGLAYYSNAINNKSIFNAEVRIKDIEIRYEAIKKRVKDEMNKCANMSNSTIDAYITKILSRNQDDVQTTQVSKLLYDRFADIYPNDINWLFYTAWKFDAKMGYDHPFGTKETASMLYTGTGSNGVTKNGGWTVFWVGHPESFSTPVPPRMFVDYLKFNEFLYYEYPRHEKKNYHNNAGSISHHLQYSWVTGRVPVSWFVFNNPPLSATIGKPISKMNVFSHRCLAEWTMDEGHVHWFKPKWISVLVMRPNTVDVIIL